VPLSQVPSLITKEAILTKLRLLNKSMIEDFGIRRPRIAVMGLNPHAGDQGVIGLEERDIIIPAINQANDEGIVAMGPYPSDGFSDRTVLQSSMQFLQCITTKGLHHSR
jgi:4-hydroxythreonine-4-phosphate dehydrogenase